MKYEFTSSLIGRIRLQCRLNDLVSNSFPLSLMGSSNPPQFDKDVQQSQLSVPFPIRRNIGSVLLGAIPHVDEEITHRKQRSNGGIALPVGVKAPQLAKKLPSSLEESSEPWTDVEDSVLQESLSRYGTNWHLAAHAVSSGDFSAPILIIPTIPELAR